MSSKKFKFVSPGIFLNEIDNSELPREPAPIGPLVIGRTARGPAMRPVQVDSFSDFVSVFGAPQAGGEGTDVWRSPNGLVPTYASYAAQAWLKNSSTINVIRLLGKHHIDKASGGEAGWKTSNGIGSSSYSSSLGAGGAFGLWVFDATTFSGSHATNGKEGAQPLADAGGKVGQPTGSLAAIWYLEQGSMGLMGNDLYGSASNEGTPLNGLASFIGSDSAGNFTTKIISDTAPTSRKVVFNLDPSHKNYIRKVFNTNPTLTNGDVTATATKENYWLGETFERTIQMEISASLISGVGGSIASTKYIGCLLGLKSGTNNHSSRQIAFEQRSGNPQTGWFFSQDLGGGSASGSYAATNMQKLFKVHGLDHGEWAQNNIKISVANVDYSSDEYNLYGTFDVLVRRISDTDKTLQVLERFSNCNLNPNSQNYIGRKIGTKYARYDPAERVLKTEGEYANRSKYIRVEMNTDVDGATTNREYLPFGVFGPLKYKDFSHGDSGAGFAFSANAPALGGGSGSVGPVKHYRRGENDAFGGKTAWKNIDVSGSAGYRVLFRFPKLRCRLSASQDDMPNLTDAFFGAWTGRGTTNPTYNADVTDLVKTKANNLDQFDGASATYTEHAWAFTLDEIVSGSSEFTWAEGTRACTTKCPGGTRPLNSKTADASYKDVLDAGIDSYTAVLYGGSDGLDITEQDPFRNTLLADKTPKSNYAFNTIKEAIDTVADPEVAQFNLVSVPGITNEGLTTHLIETCESRADALAVIDLKGDFQPASEGDAGKLYGDVNTAISNLKDRGLNSSYACAYYPWVQIRDTISGRFVYMPPSIAAIGAMSYTDRVRAPWFAPAGFNRGGLTSGVAGLPVVNVTQRLTSKERDKLYDANINPIATFPNEGIVIFGQKTLQVTRSALDRINVRRLLLFVKKGISAIASDLLFEPNVQETWDRFINRANPFLADVKAQFGLTDFKLVLDKSTTTDDLIDRNIMYAKVFLKPARSIEFIAVDFIITNTGAAFED